MGKLIGLCGYARVGKDTAAEVLVNEFGYCRIGFADSLKDEYIAEANRAWWRWLCPWWRLTREKLERPRTKRRHRAGLVRLRQNGPVHESSDYWLTIARRQWRTLLMGGARVVVPDCRYLNELAAIQGDGGCWVRVCRPGHTHANAEERCSLGEIEWMWDAGGIAPPVAVLGRSGDIEQLRAEARELARQVEG